MPCSSFCSRQGLKGHWTVKFSSNEEFELHVHKCFGKIFELLMKVDAVVREGAEKEEAAGNLGTMYDLRDWMEEITLHCHLAWQYHRLAMGTRSQKTWDHVEGAKKEKES